MNYRGFKIENRPAYIWRMYCFKQHAGHSHVACWYVQDAQGKQVAGGYDAGNNTRSGSAKLARRKDAKAWIDGFHAYQDEPDSRKTVGRYVVHGPSYASSSRDHGRDDDQQAWFEEGYQFAQRPKR